MRKEELVVNGGARIGWVNATWPLARLEASDTKLDLKVAFIGSYSFSPMQVQSIERYSSIPVLGWGIRINHVVTEHPKKIIFWTLGRPETLLQRIADVGFVPTARPAPLIAERGFPVRWQAIVAIFLIWNALFFADSGFSFEQPAQPGLLGLAAIILLFAGSILIRTSTLLQSLVLKPSRNIGEIKAAVNLVSLVSGFLSVALSVQTIASRLTE